MSVKTLKVRVKDKHACLLRRMAKDVSFVWNYLNDLSYRNIRDHGRHLSGYDMQKYLTGSSHFMSVGSQTINEVAKHYAVKRNAARRSRLSWRSAHGRRRSLGWVPIKGGSVRMDGSRVKYLGHHFDIWDSYGLEQYKFRAGSFNEDARGRWYFNVAVSIEEQQSSGTKATGIDLGCKRAATDSNGVGVRGREYRTLEAALGSAQRAGKKRRVAAIHAKIKNRRADALHKYSRKLVNENAAIFVGNVSPAGMAKTRMGKSSLDAGWGMLKTMLEYKCDHAGVTFMEVNEAYSTQACSCCGSIGDSSPKGRAGLGIREWTCTECGAVHDRDVNAARNILRSGLATLEGGARNEARRANLSPCFVGWEQPKEVSSE